VETEERVSRRDRIEWGLRAFVLLLLAWVVLDGVGDLAVAATAAALGAGLAAWLAPRAPVRLRLAALPAFLGFFLVESFRGATDVGWRALRHDLPIDPHLIRYRIAVPPGPARTLLAGVVSLLPGTLTAEVSDEGDTLTIHAITAEPKRAVRALEARIAALFGTPMRGSP